MRAAVLTHPAPIDTHPLTIADVPMPVPLPGEVLLKVLACGICHTDLHIVEGELPQRLEHVTPGHQIVAEVVDTNGTAWQRGTRVGVSWIGGTDGTCRFCRAGKENLCDQPTYTGYTHPGGYAEYTTARADFIWKLPESLTPQQAAPLLCAGIVGFRSLRVAEAQPGQRVGLFGFGASAQTNIAVLQAWGCEVYVSTREEVHRQLARSMGATWVGNATDMPPVALDCAVTFAPVGFGCNCRVALPCQGRHRGHQCHSSGLHSAVRLRLPAMGRTADSQCHQHDAKGCARLSGRSRAHRTEA